MDFVYIGKVVNTHGIKGELRILSNFDKKDLVFKAGFKFYIGNNYCEEVVKSYRKHKEFDMVLFEGYDNINQVLKYLKMNVYVKRTDLKLKDKDYLLEDLIGLKVLFAGKVLGKCEEIVYNGSNILLSITGEKHFYIPNNDYFIKDVDFLKKEINVLNVEGLIL